MATTTLCDPKMSFKYYYLDNGHYYNIPGKGRVFVSVRMMHYAEDIYEAVKEAKTMTHGEPVEIWNRYGAPLRPAAIVYPDGSVTPEHYKS